MKTALEYGSFDRFILLQGLEYPIRSNSYIERFLSRHPNTEFIKAQNISLDQSPSVTHKYRLFHYLDKKNLLFKSIEHVNAIFLKLGVIPNFKRNYVLDISGKKMLIYQGCAQFGLTREAVQYITKFHYMNPRFNRYFHSVYAADESYFHTILYNSNFATFTQNKMALPGSRLEDFENLTYFEYPVFVTLFKDKKDWERLKEKPFLFFRKASSESKELLDLIDEEHKKEEMAEKS